MNSNLINLVFGFVLGVVMYHMFFRPEIVESVTETTKVVVDSTYIELYQELKMEVNKQKLSSDSIEYYKKLYHEELKNIKIVHDSVFQTELFKAPLRHFNGSSIHIYGQTNYKALVAGELIDMKIFNDFKIPKITNTIYKDRIVVQSEKNGGHLYGGALMSQKGSIAPYGIYQKNRWQIIYKYDLNSEIHWGGFGLLIF